MRRSVVALLLVYLSVEGSCWLGLFLLNAVRGISYAPRMSVLSPAQKSALSAFLRGEAVNQDPVLGWKPSAETNSAGMRDEREYERVPPPGTVRISAFGDSFTWGEDVEWHETWEAQLAALSPVLEVLNYGVPAYGLDQAYLRYLQVGAEYDPHVVFIGYMSENIARNVNVFRPFYSSSYGNHIYTKPRFEVQQGSLVLLENPVATHDDHARFLRNDAGVLSDLGEHDYHYQSGYDAGSLDVLPSVRFIKVVRSFLYRKVLDPIFTISGMYSVDSDAFKVTEKIVDAFYTEVLARGALPVILVFPDIGDQERSRAGRERRYGPLLDAFRAKGYRYFDVLEALEPAASEYTTDELTVEWGHYSPVGNRLVAQYLLARLQRGGYTRPAAIEEAVQAERRRLGIGEN